MGVKVEGLQRVIQSFRDRASRKLKATEIAVGYSADYALAVHEDLETPHANGQAKFLEQPAREYGGEVVERTAEGVRERVLTLQEAAVLALERFLEERSKPLVPVRSGNLRDSGYVEVRAA